MNAAYSPYNIIFTLRETTFTVSDDWATQGGNRSSPYELEMKQALRRGFYADLNLYFLSNLPGGLLGFCYFPTKIEPMSPQLVRDGCINLAGSLPGSYAAPYNLGGTAVHEVGHWLGLFHVFQGASCEGPGDYVPDTPRQVTPTSGCPAMKDTCAEKGWIQCRTTWITRSIGVTRSSRRIRGRGC